MAIVGYARVSTTGQSLDVQLDKLKAKGCEKIFQEKMSGTKDNRPELEKCLSYLREGDTLVVTKIDRLARSSSHLDFIAKHLDENKIGFIATDQPFDTTSPVGRLVYKFISIIAEFENELRRERQAEGIARVKREGKIRLGAVPKLKPQQIEQLRADREAGMKISELKGKYKLSKASVYNYLDLKNRQEAS